MKLLKLILIVTFMSLTATAFAFGLDGTLTTSYEIKNDKGKSKETVWENYLSIDNAKIFDPYIGINFYGRYAKEDPGDDFTDIYSAYLDFSSFQKAVEVKAGRFAYVGNRFLTLDGALATVRTDYGFGVTAFGGSPEYFDSDGRHINETFRHTGDRLYGGRIFLNGVKDTTGYVSYSKETEDSDTLQELVGLGLGRNFIFSSAKLSLDGRMEYDTDTEEIYKGSLRMALQQNKLKVVGDMSTYNVKDGKDFTQELIISNFSSGKEDRYSLTVQYAVTDNFTPYFGTVQSRLEMPSGVVAEGEMYRLGVDVDYFRSIGVTAELEGYYYNSEVSNAKGGSFVCDWNVTRDFMLKLESEMLRLENSKTEQTIYSLYLEAAYRIMRDLTISAYGENNQETRYLPENRYGIKAAYSF